MNTIVQSKKYKGMYYINTKPVLIDNWDFMSVSGKFNDGEIRDFELLLNLDSENSCNFIKRIIYIVNAYYGVDIRNNSRKRPIIQPRQVAMYLCRQKYIGTDKISASYIGDVFNKDHSTVLHSARNITNWLEHDKELQHDIEQLSNKIEKYTINQIIVVD